MTAGDGLAGLFGFGSSLVVPAPEVSNHWSSLAHQMGGCARAEGATPPGLTHLKGVERPRIKAKINKGVIACCCGSSFVAIC